MKKLIAFPLFLSRYRIVLVFLFVILTTQKSFAENKHIKISSNDKNWIKTFKTAFQNHINKSTSDTLFLDFKAGVYSLNESLKFSADKSNTLNSPVVISGKSNVIISGSKLLNNKAFRAISNPLIKSRILSTSAQTKVLEYDLRADEISDLGEMSCIGFGRVAPIAPPMLFYNGKRMVLARYPNEGDRCLLKTRTTVIPIKKIIDTGISKIETPINSEGQKPQEGSGGIFEYTDNRVEKWLGAKDIWLDGIFTRDWAWSYNKVDKIDTLKKTISLLYTEKYDLTAANSFFFASNLIEEIDVPGEYYIDRTNGKLYFYPPQDFNINSSEIALSCNTQNFIELIGLSNIKFNGIHFEYGRTNAVVLQNCTNVSFSNCEFNNFGLSALSIDGNNNSVEGCKVHSIGCTAIKLNGGDFETLSPSKNIVKNCDIYDWAFYNRVYTPAIELKGVGNIVFGNNIYSAPHGAITISGNNHLIEKNEISYVLQEFEDYGAIYGFLGKNQLMRGDTICGNYFHDIGAVGDRIWAIYIDESTAGWLIDRNLFYKIGNKGSRIAAVFGNTCTYVNVTNNLFLDCSETFDLSFHFATWAKKKLDYFKKEWAKQYGENATFPPVYLEHYPELKHFMTDERVFVNSNSFIGNTVGNFSIPLSHKDHFMTRNGTSESYKCVQAADNKFITDNSMITFLEKWNNAKTKQSLKDSIPADLAKYLYLRP
ncbi:MAG: right-handed parallel beta-helix repeat-containing protein [Paludibacter sp.]